MNRKDESLKQTLFLSEQRAVSKNAIIVRSAVFCPSHRPGPQSLLSLVYCLSMTTCLKSAQLCQVASIGTETMQLVISQFINVLP